ncbi:cyclin-D1-binding protein 1 homolog isoform X2 [Pimephales promelas]|uniref:cyclin-D1-binding protein 1 homolog isoform X2 n=1 Tax=Pimephales promelas TaxID=90988 RepID=UPI0019558E34|nr:cyclin-D1-binding protein 1 homolog isoform X2 [Pimephales promelas]KAG1930185.1 cyclin-D1-binding protein [Pimephales promelas]
MSADNSRSDALLPLRNLSNLVRCSRDRVRDGESNESSGMFSLSNFWENLNDAVKVTSQEATKLSLIFSKPPSEEDCAEIAGCVQKSVLTLSTVYFWLPKSQGVTLRKAVRDATVEVLDELLQLTEVILSSPVHSLSQEQLMSTGGVWAACDKFNQLPKDNRSAVLAVLTSYAGLVKDALAEMEEALAETEDPFADVLPDDDDDEDGEGVGGRGNQDTYWSPSDRLLVCECRGLMKASGASLRKLSSAVRNSGSTETEENITQLDDLADAAHDISPSVDDLALSLYPPVDRPAVNHNVCKLAGVLKKVLEITRSSHVCGEADVCWVQFLSGAVQHNLEKLESLLSCGS